MYIFFNGKTAQEHPLHRLDPGVNEVPDDVGKRLKRIAKDGALPVRDATPAEERAFKDARAKREAELRAADEKARKEAAAAAAPAEEDDVDPTPAPEPAPPSAEKGKA